jgi:hypothetical protein
MRRWEVAFGILVLLTAEACSSLVRKLRKFSFL